MRNKIISAYYVYYDKKTGEIFSVTNEKSNEYEHGIEVEYHDVQKFLTGEWRSIDYKVGYKDTNDKSSLSILNSDYFYLDYNFKNRTFNWIGNNDSADCIVEWNGLTRSWNFSLTDEFKKTYNNNIIETQLTFFVTLSNDFDFLIRSMFIKMTDILSLDKVVIPFDSNLENKINKITIGTKTVFKNYGLRIVHE
jgi:hypothetical protein